VLGYNILGSYAADWASRHPDVGIVLPKDYTVVMSRIGLVPQAPSRPDLGRRYLEFFMSKEGQTIMARELQIPAVNPEVSGENTANTDAGDARRPIAPVPVSPGLMVYLDQVKRSRADRALERGLAHPLTSGCTQAVASDVSLMSGCCDREVLAHPLEAARLGKYGRTSNTFPLRLPDGGSHRRAEGPGNAAVIRPLSRPVPSPQVPLPAGLRNGATTPSWHPSSPAAPPAAAGTRRPGGGWDQTARRCRPRSRKASPATFRS
jgi:hypothetical protein